MDKEIIKHYTNGELTIVWKPSLCIHSKNCWNAVTGMPQVFDPRKRPWISMENGPSSKEIETQVRKCPSGALATFYNDDEATKNAAGSGGKEDASGNEGKTGQDGKQVAVAGETTTGEKASITNGQDEAASGILIRVLPNGPLIVQGHCDVVDANGNSVKKTDNTAFCRCGFSSNKPYCDGSHASKGFVG